MCHAVVPNLSHSMSRQALGFDRKVFRQVAGRALVFAR
jgi:hypothetical protein